MRLLRHAEIVIAALCLAACGASNSPAPLAPPPPASSGTGIIKYFDGPDACASLEKHIEDTADSMMRDQLAPALAFDPSRVQVGVPLPPTATPTAAGDASALSTDSTFSTTNVQVAGVDELDVIKNSRSHLYSLELATDGEIELRKIQLLPANAPRLAGAARWPSMTAANGVERAIGLFSFDADRVAAVTSSGPYYGQPIDVVPLGTAAASRAAPSICLLDRCGDPAGPWLPPRTTIRLFDVAGDSTPSLAWSSVLSGHILGARRIGDTMYVVTQSPLQMPHEVRWWPSVPVGAAPTSTQWRAAVAELIDSNAKAIRAQSLAQWLQALDLNTPSPTAPDVPTNAQCAAFAQIDMPTRLAWLRVHTIDVKARTVKHETVLSEGASIYVAPSALIVATPYWNFGTAASSAKALTTLHRFVLGADSQARYSASGQIPGTLINSYAIDEAVDGTLRVAGSDSDQDGPFSYVAVLRTTAGKLQVIGRSAALARGERLQSARFLGQRAYLVTFRQIDPFFVFDLSDPTNPTQLGELKIPGFSTYLHPFGDSHVLGIGYDGAGAAQRIKATLFDVRDPSTPVEQATLLLSQSSRVSSEALNDPRGLTFYPLPGVSGTTVVAIPLHDQFAVAGAPDESGIKLIKVNPAATGSALLDGGAMPMRGWNPRRGLFVDDNVYGYSEAGVRAAKIAAPGTVLGTLVFAAP